MKIATTGVDMNGKVKKTSLLLVGLLAISACGAQSADEAQVVVENAQSDDAASSTDDAGSSSETGDGTGADDSSGSLTPANDDAGTLKPADVSNTQGEASASGNDALADTAPLVMGERTEGNIEQLFGADRWTFDATEGQLLTVDLHSVESGGDGCWQDLFLYLIVPSGDRFELDWVGNNGCKGHGPYELEETGEYMIEFAGGSGSSHEPTGSYSFTPSFLTELDSYPAAFGSRNDGEISQLFGTDRWTFDGKAGQLLTVDLESVEGDGSGCWQDLTLYLVVPSGDKLEVGWVGNNGCKGHGPFELDEDGAYALEFAGGSGASHVPAGTYRFTPSLAG